MSGLLHPLGHLPHGTEGEGGQSGLHVEEPQAGSTTNACVAVEELLALLASYVIRKVLFSICGEGIVGYGEVGPRLMSSAV